MRRNVTLSADEELIAAARRKAAAEHSTLNAQFRRWLAVYVGTRRRGRRFDEIMAELDHAESGGPFGRDEMNER